MFKHTIVKRRTDNENGQKQRDKMTNNDLQHIAYTTKDIIIGIPTEIRGRTRSGAETLNTEYHSKEVYIICHL